MTRNSSLRRPQLLLAILFMFAGIISIRFLNSTELEVAGNNLTSLGLLLSGLVFYVGVLMIVSMFENETLLSIALLFPSIVAVAIFVYGFIAWSVRVSLANLDADAYEAIGRDLKDIMGRAVTEWRRSHTH